jgi:hypothetical protein
MCRGICHSAFSYLLILHTSVLRGM